MRWGFKSAVAVFVVGLGLASPSQGALMFSESFGTLPHLTVLSPSNTALTWVRSPSGTKVAATNPSPISTGASAELGAHGLTNPANLAGFGASGLTATDVTTLSFKFRTNNTSPALFIGMGTGTTFTGDSPFTASHLTWGVQLMGSKFQTRISDATWSNITTNVLAANTTHEIRIVANGSSAAVTYGDATLPAGKGHLYVNGLLWGNTTFTIRDAVSASAFRIYALGGGATYAFDDLQIWNEATAIPEPASGVLLLGAGAVGLMGGRRRRRE